MADDNNQNPSGQDPDEIVDAEIVDASDGIGMDLVHILFGDPDRTPEEVAAEVDDTEIDDEVVEAELVEPGEIIPGESAEDFQRRIRDRIDELNDQLNPDPNIVDAVIIEDEVEIVDVSTGIGVGFLYGTDLDAYQARMEEELLAETRPDEPEAEPETQEKTSEPVANISLADMRKLAARLYNSGESVENFIANSSGQSGADQALEDDIATATEITRDDNLRQQFNIERQAIANDVKGAASDYAQANFALRLANKIVENNPNVAAQQRAATRYTRIFNKAEMVEGIDGQKLYLIPATDKNQPELEAIRGVINDLGPNNGFGRIDVNNQVILTEQGLGATRDLVDKAAGQRRFNEAGTSVEKDQRNIRVERPQGSIARRLDARAEYKAFKEESKELAKLERELVRDARSAVRNEQIFSTLVSQPVRKIGGFFGAVADTFKGQGGIRDTLAARMDDIAEYRDAEKASHQQSLLKRGQSILDGHLDGRNLRGDLLQALKDSPNAQFTAEDLDKGRVTNYLETRGVGKDEKRHAKEHKKDVASGREERRNNANWHDRVQQNHDQKLDDLEKAKANSVKSRENSNVVNLEERRAARQQGPDTRRAL